VKPVISAIYPQTFKRKNFTDISMPIIWYGTCEIGTQNLVSVRMTHMLHVSQPTQLLYNPVVLWFLL
jgi:hypothetical protein